MRNVFKSHVSVHHFWVSRFLISVLTLYRPHIISPTFCFDQLHLVLDVLHCNLRGYIFGKRGTAAADGSFPATTSVNLDLAASKYWQITSMVVYKSMSPRVSHAIVSMILYSIGSFW